jgi:hypothetical protein
MTTREQLHKLIDELPECDLGAVQLLIEWRDHLRDDRMALLHALAPLDDEPLTLEDEVALAEADEAIARGDVYSLDEVRRELGL